jgi:hypothetical protein
VTLSDLAILFRPFGFISPKTLNYLAFQSILNVPDEVYSKNVSCILNLISTFLAHLAIRRPLTFHILIFSSETAKPIDLKFGRKHLCKVSEPLLHISQADVVLSFILSRLVIGTSRTVGSAKKFVRITSGFGGGEFTKTLRKVCTCQKLKFAFLLLEYCKIRECYVVANAFTIRNMYSLLLYMKCSFRYTPIRVTITSI